MKNKYVKTFENYINVNETIDRTDFQQFADVEPSFTYVDMDAFEKSLKEYDGSFDTKAMPWGDVIKIDEELYILSEYGNGYMVFEHITNKNDYFTVNYEPVRSNVGKPTKPFQFYDID